MEGSLPLLSASLSLSLGIVSSKDFRLSASACSTKGLATIILVPSTRSRFPPDDVLEDEEEEVVVAVLPEVDAASDVEKDSGAATLLLPSAKAVGDGVRRPLLSTEDVIEELAMEPPTAPTIEGMEEEEVAAEEEKGGCEAAAAAAEKGGAAATISAKVR